MVQFANLDKKYGFPEGTLASLYEQETSSGKNVRASTKGAQGHFQFMPKTQQEVLRNTGINAYGDVNEAANAAGYYLSQKVKEQGGSLAKGLAAYNAGSGNVNKAEARGGKNWLATMTKETRDYVPSILGRIGSNTKEIDDEVAFTERYSRGETSAEENELHARRRRELLEGAGVDTSNMSLDMLLGKMFMALITNFIEGVASKEHGTSKVAEKPQGEEVSSGSSVSPNAPTKVATAQDRSAPTPA